MLSATAAHAAAESKHPYSLEEGGGAIMFEPLHRNSNSRHLKSLEER